MWKQWQIVFWGAPKSLKMVTAAMKLRRFLFGRKAMTNLDSVLKIRDIALQAKVRIVKAMVFPVVIYRWDLDHKEAWVPKNWCFWTVVLEKTTLESPLDSKDIKLLNFKNLIDNSQMIKYLGKCDKGSKPIWRNNKTLLKQDKISC